MKRVVFLALFSMIYLACRVMAQPCECKWPVDVIILQNLQGQEGIPDMKASSDSLKKKCRYLFVIAPRPSSTDTIPYTILKAGKGNRIMVIGAVKLRKDGTPAGKKPGTTTFNEVEHLKKRHLLLAAPHEIAGNDQRLEQLMPRFDFIIEKTFIRLDRGNIVFIKEL